jgi:hypothetical protein
LASSTPKTRLIERDLNRSAAINDPHQGKFAEVVERLRDRD